MWVDQVDRFASRWTASKLIAVIAKLHPYQILRVVLATAKPESALPHIRYCRPMTYSRQAATRGFGF